MRVKISVHVRTYVFSHLLDIGNQGLTLWQCIAQVEALSFPLEEEEEYEPVLEDSPGMFLLCYSFLIRSARLQRLAAEPTEESLASQALEGLPRSQTIEALLAFNAMKYVPPLLYFYSFSSIPSPSFVFRYSLCRFLRQSEAMLINLPTGTNSKPSSSHSETEGASLARKISGNLCRASRGLASDGSFVVGVFV
jgi:hypothetical protein